MASHEVRVQLNSTAVALKPEYLVVDHVPTLAVDCVSKNDMDLLDVKLERPPDRFDFKRNRNVLKGQNKNRGPTYNRNAVPVLCPTLSNLQEGQQPMPTCPVFKCKYVHDVDNYLKTKPDDIGDECYVFKLKGFCPRGLKCRFGKMHITENGRNVIDQEKYDNWTRNYPNFTSNFLTKDVQFALRKKNYNFDKSLETLKLLDCRNESTSHDSAEKSGHHGSTDDENAGAKHKFLVADVDSNRSKTSVVVDNEIPGSAEQNSDTSAITAIEPHVESEGSPCKRARELDDKMDLKSPNNVSNELGEQSGGRIGYHDDTDKIRLKVEEKKKINWKGKLILSPLTTVGNLPFRRICKEFGADVTCGEMAVATSLLQGMAPEWALVRKHHTENIFGVQLCGNNPPVMTKCAQLLQDQAELDFIDVNLGCPIDLIVQEGSGSALLRKDRILERILNNMNHVLDVPLTVKARAGINKYCTDKLIPKFVKSGVSLISIHGRTRDQRYTKLSDWDYIEECAKLAGDVPVFGNGDILSFTDYNYALENHPYVSGALIARGALYKPWLFTEIKEQRHWDISSSERLEIVKKYVNYGLDHWGSDDQGVENTRRFLLEWLSFLYRYIPIGLLEYPPQRINQRPPVYRGRDELETLFASPNCQDWIKISEMLLGPVPEGFRFLPKHKANSWK